MESIGRGCQCSMFSIMERCVQKTLMPVTLHMILHSPLTNVGRRMAPLVTIYTECLDTCSTALSPRNYATVSGPQVKEIDSDGDISLELNPNLKAILPKCHRVKTQMSLATISKKVSTISKLQIQQPLGNNLHV